MDDKQPISAATTQTGRARRASGRVRGRRAGERLRGRAGIESGRGRALESLHRSQEQYRILFQVSRDAIMTLAPPEWKFTSCNAATVRMFGAKDEAEFTSVGPWAVSPEYQPDGRPSADKAREMIETAMREGSHFFEWTHKRFGGSDFPTTVLLSRVEVDGQTFLQATVRDITEQRRAEEALAAALGARTEETAKLRAVIEGMEEGVIVADADDVVTEVNSWFLNKVGLRREDVAGKSIWAFHHDTQVAARVREVLDRFRSGRCRHTHVVNRHLLGMELMLRVQPIFQDASYRGVVLNVIDVTDLVEARRAAEAANAAKSVFLANMSHEIRTPMTAILGFAEVVRDEIGCCEKCPSCLGCDTRRRNRENLETICMNGRHLMQIINDILDLSKIEAGSMSVEKIPVVPHEILESVASLMRPRASEKGVEFRLCYAGPIPEVIQSDPVRLRQAILNLVGNAIKFTQAGSVTLRVGLGGSQEAAQLVVEVIDTGIGIPADRLEAVFKPFKQADDSTTRKFGGTGLGLTITKRLAELLGGSLEVASEAGKGSVFTLRLPVGSLDGVRLLEGPVRAPASQHLKETEASSGPLNARILLVEDGPDNRRLITHLLRRAGAEVDIAEDGRAGAEKVLTAWGKGAPYDAVLMDMQMPVMDGYQATRYLREKGYAGPIIALTAHSMAGDREKCLAAGCNDFASKPVSREELLRTIRRHLSPPAVGNAGGTASSGSLVSELAGDAEMADIVEMFVAELPGKIAAIEDALARQDLATLGAIAHQLKGAAGGYGFPSITEAAMALEVGAKAQEDLDSLRQRLEALADLCQRARAGAMRRPTERDEPTRPIA